MQTLDLQDFIFHQNPSRMDLMNYQAKSGKKFRITVYRNHSFEMVAHTMAAYLDYAGFQVEFTYSDYDDSLSFLGLDTAADLLILWIDLSRYQNSDLKTFIQTRLTYLKTIYDKPILFVPFGADFHLSDSRIVTYDLTPIQAQLQDKYIDKRLEPFSGTLMSPAASMQCSKDLGLNYIPALLMPLLKGIVIDLDNTIYQGVLGEDGIDGIVLTKGYLRLQQKLKELSQKGFFLCVASKNDEADVQALFEQRKDFPLRLSDFSKICAHWGSKADSVTQICQFLNIHEDSLVFIDDNRGELLSVKQAHPAIHLIYAENDAFKTAEVLSNYPRLLKLGIQNEDRLRRNDTKANEERHQLQQTLSKEEYIKDLKMALTFDSDNPKHMNRVAELSNKTNQFIFNYKRYSVSEVEALTRDAGATVVAVSLKDRLSDSGIIGVVVLKKTEQGAMLEECFVSCRALGRGIDEAIVLGAIEQGMNNLNARALKIQFRAGERNTPALKFIEAYLKPNTTAYAEFDYQINHEKHLIITIKRGETHAR